MLRAGIEASVPVPVAPAAVAERRPAAAAPRSDIRLAVEGLTVRYGTFAALDDVSLRVPEGSVVCLLGPSGSGKSTLLRLVAGLERPTAGRIVLDGVEVAGSRAFVEPERRRVGLMFQDYALFPHLTIAANVAFGLRGRSRREIDDVTHRLLGRLGLQRHASSYPHVLSGGERQRVALARALAPAPRVLLMDEPFSSLDDRLRDRVREETLQVLRETGTTTVVVTHDPGEAMRIADTIVLLRSGRVVQQGRPDDLYARPATVFAARFFSEVNELRGTCRAGRAETALCAIDAPHLPDGSACIVCMRPEQVRVVGAPTPLAGHVVRATYLGAIQRLVVAVAGLDVPLTADVHGRRRFDPGDPVFLHLDAGDAVVLPAGRDPDTPSSHDGASAC